ncbi:MAG: hypothetical protein E6Q35_02330, partial [Chryseobacterium cucumeris]
MEKESPYSPYKFHRELIYSFLQSAVWYQWTLLGSPKGAWIDVHKGFWSSATDWIRDKFFGKINARPEYHGGTVSVNPENVPDGWKYTKTNIEFPEGTVDRDRLDSEDQEIFDFLNQNWNEVYKEYRDRSTLLGHIAEYMVNRGEEPEVMKDWNLEELNTNLTEKHNLPGLDEVEELMKQTGFDRERVYQLIYAKSKGAEWLAVYDENGERKGKAYESVTRMYREQIAEAMTRNATVDEIKSLMIFPDDSILKEADEKKYQQWIKEHLNRDWHRFAVTEAAINYENGKLLQGLAESDPDSPVYYMYVRQTAPKAAKHKPVTCERCMEWSSEGVIARLFPSYGAVTESEYFDGEDQLSGEPFASVAIWPGKSNAERGSMGSWWCCTPAHPNCSCHWIRFEPKEKEHDDEISSIFERSRRRNVRHQDIITKEYEKDR